MMDREARQNELFAIVMASPNGIAASEIAGRLGIARKLASECLCKLRVSGAAIESVGPAALAVWVPSDRAAIVSARIRAGVEERERAAKSAANARYAARRRLGPREDAAEKIATPTRVPNSIFDFALACGERE